MTLGGKEERELHLSLVAILLHVGIKIKAGVVERTRPLGVNTYGIALAVGKHRARKLYGVIVLRRIAHTELPLTCKRYRILSLDVKAKYHAKKKSQTNSFVHRNFRFLFYHGAKLHNYC